MTDYTPEWLWFEGNLMGTRPDGLSSEQILWCDTDARPSWDHAELIASAPRLKQERDDLLDGLKKLLYAHVGGEPSMEAKRNARELIKRIDRE